MFLLPLLVLAITAFVVYKVVQHHAHAVSALGPAHAPVLSGASVWPTTPAGKLGVAALGLSLLPVLLVNVVQVPYLSAATMLLTLGLTSFARFGEHDRSTSVLVALCVSAAATAAGLLFLTGEVLIGHD